VAADFDPERLSCQSFEWRCVPRRRPELQLRVAGRAELQQVVVTAVVEFEARDGLGVAAIETFREPQDRGERPHRAARAPPQIREAVVLPLRRRLAVIARDEGDDLDFLGIEAAQIAVANQVVRVLVMAAV